jgi:nuclear transport factor 2 (NTF2) superfamily protein
VTVPFVGGTFCFLKTVSDRWSIEEQFHDVKEIWGAGEQRVRNVWFSVGCWNLCGWFYTMVELECWDDSREQLVKREGRLWDNPDRRPSHDDRRRKIAREMLREVFLSELASTPNESKIRDQFERLLLLAA